MEMKENNSRMLSSLFDMRSLLQEEMILDSTALEDAKIEDASVDDATYSAATVCIGASDDDLIGGNSRMIDILEENYSRHYASKVFDEMPHCCSKVFEIFSVGSAELSDALVISSELNSGLDDDKIEELDIVTNNIDLQPLVIVTGDTESEIKEHEALSIASVNTELGVKFDFFLDCIGEQDVGIVSFNT